MSPTLKKSVSFQFLLFVRVSRILSVPVGLHVGREADHTALLEATAEGILLVVVLAMLPTNSSNFVIGPYGCSKGGKIRVSQGNNVPECRRGDRTSEA